MNPLSPPLSKRAPGVDAGVTVTEKEARDWHRSKDGPVASLFSMKDGGTTAPTEPLLSAADALFSLHTLAGGGGGFPQQLSDDEEEEDYGDEGDPGSFDNGYSDEEYSLSEDDAQLGRGMKRKPGGGARRQYTSPFHGVSWHKSSQRWAVQIRHDGKRVHVGYYTKEMDAAKAYDKVAKKLRGASARTNFAPNGTMNVKSTKGIGSRAPRGGPLSPPLDADRTHWRGKPSNKALLSSAPAASPRPGKRRRGGRDGTALATALATVEDSDGFVPSDDSEEEFKPRVTARKATRGRGRRTPRGTVRTPTRTPRTKKEKEGVISREDQRALDMYFVDTRVQQYVHHLAKPVRLRGIGLLQA